MFGVRCFFLRYVTLFLIVLFCMCLASLRRSLKRGRHAEAKAEAKAEAEAEAATTPPPAMVTKPFSFKWWKGRQGKGREAPTTTFLPFASCLLVLWTLTEALVSVTTAAALVVARPDSLTHSLSLSLFWVMRPLDRHLRKEERRRRRKDMSDRTRIPKIERDRTMDIWPTTE